MNSKIKTFFNKVILFFKKPFTKTKSENFKNSLSSFMASIICIIFGLVLGLIILLMIDYQNASMIFSSILKGGFGETSGSGGWLHGLGNQLTYTAPLICVGLSVLFAYKSGMFNIGCAGQFTLGAFGALLFAIAFKCPWWLCIIGAMLFGAIWGAIPGIFKAYFKVNEVITCIMSNWIGLYFVNDMFKYRVKIDYQLGPSMIDRIFYNSKSLTLGSTNPSAIIPNIGLGKLFTNNPTIPSSLTISIFIAIIVTIIILVILNHSILGFEIKACGANKNASEYAGINQKSRIIISMAISGALAGLGAALLYLTDIEQFPQDTTKLSGLAFNGIPIAFMAVLNPVGVIFASFFVAHIEQGAGLLTGSMYSKEMSSVFTGIIIYFCAFTPLVISLIRKSIIRKREEKENKHDENKIDNTVKVEGDKE